MADFPKTIRKLIDGFERLPGIGPKGASRLVFYLLSTPESYIKELADNLLDLKKTVLTCKKCYGVAEKEVCSICDDESRNKKLICVVEGFVDVMVIESVGGYKGVYHVLGGVVNPLNRVGPDDLKIAELLDRVRRLGEGVEIILATNSTMEGEATALYIKKRLDSLKIVSKVSRIGSGLPMGALLEYADQATLSRAMEGRRDW